ncbi:MAG: CoB--CoM heterodisulfide reductase iron-sulfur subunit B family protein [Nitrospiraceae bacterium]|nr:CoB--CoM heterodisulfide reductase iron-sulfur subunit B family protein [Nitrospiraceae bacterium]
MTDKKLEQVAYYPGCSLHLSSQFYDLQNKLIFPKLGIELKEIDDWNCCGATSASKTDDFLSIALPARNLGIADATGLSDIFIPCSSCYSRMLTSQTTLKNDAVLKNRINKYLAKKNEGRIEIKSILEVLLPLVESGDISNKITKKLNGLKPVCYYGCLLTRFPKDIAVNDDAENPQSMEKICNVLGAEPLDWNYKTDCCGASAAINDTETSLILMSKIIKDAEAYGANCFVTTCPMCHMNLDAYQDRIRSNYGISGHLPVYLLTELIGIAMGISPEELQMDRHFTEAVKLLRDIKII